MSSPMVACELAREDDVYETETRKKREGEGEGRGVSGPCVDAPGRVGAVAAGTGVDAETFQRITSVVAKLNSPKL